MADAEPSSAEEAKKRRRYSTILVTVPGWPLQDPGRRMVYSVRPTPQKAARMIKRLRKKMPEYEWFTEQLTAPEVRAIKLAPFVVRGPDFAMPMEVQFTIRSCKVVPVKES